MNNNSHPDIIYSNIFKLVYGQWTKNIINTQVKIKRTKNYFPIYVSVKNMESPSLHCCDGEGQHGCVCND